MVDLSFNHLVAHECSHCGDETKDGMLVESDWEIEIYSEYENHWLCSDCRMILRRPENYETNIRKETEITQHLSDVVNDMNEQYEREGGVIGRSIGYGQLNGHAEENLFFNKDANENHDSFGIIHSQLNQIISKLSKDTHDEKNSESVTAENIIEVLEDEKAKKEQIDIEKKSQETIYRWKGSPKHQIGWILFFILAPWGFIKYFKLKKKKVKINNPFDEVKDKFESWRLNIYGSLGFYVIFFILIEQALTKFRPGLEKFVNNHQSFAFWITALLLGILLVIDGFISSNLKTNLQRLSFNVEKTIDDKDLKKKIFFKTQDSTETLKENFKKFGMLAIPTMIVGILGTRWKEHWLSYGYYLIPVGYSFVRILEVNSILKKIKLIKATNDNSH